jgi:hypothetical protein
MKSAHLSKFVGASLLALSMLSAPAIEPASAQTTTTPYGTDRPAGTVYTTRDDGFDWGWLGLLGLLGLAGLAGRKNNDEPTRYREPNEVGTPGSRY